jgi:hypothetical protein
MAYYRYKTAVKDNLEEAMDIIKNVGRMIQADKIDKQSTLNNLKAAFNKVKAAEYYVDRE